MAHPEDSGFPSGVATNEHHMVHDSRANNTLEQMLGLSQDPDIKHDHPEQDSTNDDDFSVLHAHCAGRLAPDLRFRARVEAHHSRCLRSMAVPDHPLFRGTGQAPPPVIGATGGQTNFNTQVHPAGAQPAQGIAPSAPLPPAPTSNVQTQSNSSPTDPAAQAPSTVQSTTTSQNGGTNLAAADASTVATATNDSGEEHSSDRHSDGATTGEDGTDGEDETETIKSSCNIL